MIKPLYILAMLCSILVLSACGGGGGSSVSAPVTAATPALSFDIKTFRFSWSDVSDATFYRLQENPDGSSGYTQMGSDIAQGLQTTDHSVALYNRINASYILQSCNTGGCTDSSAINVAAPLVEAIGYAKASNTDTDDNFGYAISLSDDGNTLAVGAYFEDSSATGVGGDQTDNGAVNSGAAYVFSRSGSAWTQQAYLKASNTGAGDEFGRALSLSDDGNTLAVGAILEDSTVTGVDGDQTDNSATDAGAAYVFSRSGSAWTQQSYLKASNTGAGDYFGYALSLSDDGNTLAVGAILEASTVTGVDGDQTDNSATDAGAAYVFSRSGSAWIQQAYVKASNTGAGDLFGRALSLSGDGNTLAVSADREASAATGVDGDQNDDSATDAGAAYVFSRSGSTWTQQAYIKASNTEASDLFGRALSLSVDGNTLAVGAYFEDSSATGVGGDQTDNIANDAGAAYVFSRSGSAWTQQAYVKASNPGVVDYFGYALSLSGDGNTLAVGAYREASVATGIGGDQTDNSASGSGAAYVFSRSGSAWTQQAYLKASNTGAGDYFGRALSLSSDGNTLAVSAYREDSAATGVGGDLNDNNAATAGAVYLY